MYVSTYGGVEPRHWSRWSEEEANITLGCGIYDWDWESVAIALSKCSLIQASFD